MNESDGKHMNLSEISLEDLCDLLDVCQMQIAIQRRKLDEAKRENVPEYETACRNKLKIAEKTKADILDEIGRRQNEND